MHRKNGSESHREPSGLKTINSPINNEPNSWHDDTEYDSVPLSSGSSLRQGLDFGTDRRADSNKLARSVRVRILTLMVLLLVVIFAMKEAGKPERWMWMGFDKPNQTPEAGDFLVDASDGSANVGSPSTMDWSIAKSASASINGRATGVESRAEAAFGLDATMLRQSSGGELDREFWQAAYQRLSEEKQWQLFGLLRKVVRSDLSAPEEAAALKKIVARLTKEQTTFQTLALGEISLMDDADEKKQRIEALFEFDQRWQKEISPTLSAAVEGEDFSFAGQLEIRKVVQVLRPQVLGAVEDLAGMGTRSDLPGWLTVWDEAVAGSPMIKPATSDSTTATAATANAVSFLQLSGQPDFYRARVVFIEGQARTCRKKILQETRLPVDHYYEVWVEPVASDGDGLFCVYSAGIPQSFPVDLLDQEPGKFHEVNVPVSLTGRFFKIRSYRDSGGGVSHSPVVIAHQIDLASTQFGASAASAKRVVPGTTSFALWFLGIAVVATGLAVAVFRSSGTPTRQLGQSTAKRMHRSLEMLEQDQSIKTPAQRVAELAEAKSTDATSDTSDTSDNERETDQ